MKLSFRSPAWLNNPVEFVAEDLGWSGTNEGSYQEGGAHLKQKLMLENPGEKMKEIVENHLVLASDSELTFSKRMS